MIKIVKENILETTNFTYKMSKCPVNWIISWQLSTYYTCEMSPAEAFIFILPVLFDERYFKELQKWSLQTQPLMKGIL